jgi:hypothetical protein
MELHARRTTAGPGFELRPATITREWMDATLMRFAYHCLPLSIANQAGWVVTCPLAFTATWDGKGVDFAADDPAEAARWAPFIGERAGLGIVSFRLPYAFTSDPALALLLRGPTNWVLPGAFPLDGYVATGEGEARPTMDWKLAEAGRPVRFERDMPIGLLVPIPADLLEDAVPRIVPIEAVPEVEGPYRRWAESRRSFLDDPIRKDGDWQKDYFHGKTLDGERASGHKTRLSLRAFTPEP